MNEKEIDAKLAALDEEMRRYGEKCVAQLRAELEKWNASVLARGGQKRWELDLIGDMLYQFDGPDTNGMYRLVWLSGQTREVITRSVPYHAHTVGHMVKDFRKRNKEEAARIHSFVARIYAGKRVKARTPEGKVFEIQRYQKEGTMLPGIYLFEDGKEVAREGYRGLIMSRAEVEEWCTRLIEE